MPPKRGRGGFGRGRGSRGRGFRGGRGSRGRGGSRGGYSGGQYRSGEKTQMCDKYPECTFGDQCRFLHYARTITNYQDRHSSIESIEFTRGTTIIFTRDSVLEYGGSSVNPLRCKLPLKDSSHYCSHCFGEAMLVGTASVSEALPGNKVGDIVAFDGNFSPVEFFRINQFAPFAHGYCTTAISSTDIGGHQVFLTGGGDFAVRVWSPEFGHLTTLEGHIHHIHDIQPFPGTPFVATLAGDGVIRIWGLKGEKAGGCDDSVCTFALIGQGLDSEHCKNTAMAVYPDEEGGFVLLVGCERGEIFCFALQPSGELVKLCGPESREESLKKHITVLTPIGSSKQILAVGHSDGCTTLCHLPSLQFIGSFAVPRSAAISTKKTGTPPAQVNTIVAGPDANFFIGTNDGIFKHIELDEVAIAKTVEGPGGSVEQSIELF
eukprot:TRINITY_DN11672_c0_g1_i1.p1 TRINITY_DN11672_c0_g1~~TRINITY_DN11672_c0_g1_i1.p1  ORF type:complete len:433 (-),score=122.00 TRINITY_DN11672_c0_g1_i1:863-2161(-)